MGESEIDDGLPAASLNNSSAAIGIVSGTANPNAFATAR
jgi:hypothetical protein